MYETIVITTTALSLFTTLALELMDIGFDRRRFAKLRTARAKQRPPVASPRATARWQLIPIDQAA
jgi:hypothetical protein